MSRQYEQRTRCRSCWLYVLSCRSCCTFSPSLRKFTMVSALACSVVSFSKTYAASHASWLDIVPFAKAGMRMRPPIVQRVDLTCSRCSVMLCGALPWP